MNNHPYQIQKQPPSKQGKGTLKLLLSTNPHPKEDLSTTPMGKSPLKLQKHQKKEHEQLSIPNPKKSPSKQGKETLKLLSGTNPHPKLDRSTTSTPKNPLNPRKHQKKGPQTIIYIKIKKLYHQRKVNSHSNPSWAPIPILIQTPISVQNTNLKHPIQTWSNQMEEHPLNPPPRKPSKIDNPGNPRWNCSNKSTKKARTQIQP